MARTLSREAHTKALVAARELLLEQGPEACTVDAVAQRSGVAKTTIYRHFASAHELLVAALDSLIEPVPTPNTGSLRQDLAVLFGSRLHLANDEDLRPLILGLLSSARRDPELRRLHEALERERTLPVRTVLELARARGEIRADVDLDQAIELIEGPLFLHVFVRQEPLSPEHLSTLIDLAVRALVPAPT